MNDPRTARLNRKTFPDVVEKVQRLGTPWLEQLVRSAPEPQPVSNEPPPETLVVRMRCTSCQHEQSVNSATYTDVGVAPNKERHYYFGSRFSHCDECDGPVQEIP